MRLPDWVWKMNLTGKVAFANLSCIAICLIVYLALFGTDIVQTDLEPAWKLTAREVMVVFLMVLTFPIGWIGVVVLHATLLLVPLVPLNAYAWGMFATWVRGVIGPKPATIKLNFGRRIEND